MEWPGDRRRFNNKSLVNIKHAELRCRSGETLIIYIYLGNFNNNHATFLFTAIYTAKLGVLALHCLTLLFIIEKWLANRYVFTVVIDGFSNVNSLFS